MPSVALLPLLLITDIFALSRKQRAECEVPTAPAPRSQKCSVKRSDEKKWTAFQQSLAADAANYTANGRVQLLMVGDSITEAFRGTAIGEPKDRSVGIDAVLRETLALTYPPSPLVLAISGDETQHILWRLSDAGGGELRNPQLRNDKHLLITLMIGTNNLGNAKHAPEPTADGVLAIATELLRRTHGKLLLNAVLPRGEPPLKPGRRAPPYTSFMPALTTLNERVRHAVPTLEARFPGRVRFHDCNARFLNDAHAKVAAAAVAAAAAAAAAVAAVPPPQSARTNEVQLGLMPDALHPNIEGSRIWAACLADGLERLCQQRATGMDKNDL
jgi:lysophospholipase L1-like esterase